MSQVSTDRTIGAGAEHANPYVGPRSIRYGQPIYGRAKEIADLLSTLVAQRIVLLYSPSGAGKSSLVEAGLRPELERREFQVLPTIRVGLEPSQEFDGVPVRNRYVLSTLLSLEQTPGAELGLSRAELATIEMADYLGRIEGKNGAKLDPCLVFDQFEELFTLDPTDVSAKGGFVEELGVALRDRGRWALFSIREDFIAQLDPYVSLIPTRLSARYRLDLLGPEAARAAVKRPAADAGVDFVDEASRLLVDDLRRVKVQRAAGAAQELGPHVEPVQLQVVCHQLWSTLSPDATSIQPDDVRALGSVDEALADFYVTQVRTVAADTGVSEREIRMWIDDQLISENGFRMQVLNGPGEHGLPVLRGLENAHLIRAERHRGTDWYELAHDRLVEPILENNLAWRASLGIVQREAQAWQRRGRPAGLLLTGVTLAEAQTWAAEHREELNDVDREFLEASIAQNHRVEKEQHSARRRLAIASSLGIASLLIFITVGVLLVRTRGAEDRAQSQVRLGAAYNLSLQANLLSDDNPALAIALAAEAASATDPPVPQAVDALVDARNTLADRGAQQIGEPLRGHTSGVRTVAFSPKGSLIASGDADGTVRLWNPETGAAVGQPLTGHTAGVNAVAFSPDGTILASASDDNTVRLWDPSTGQQLGKPLTGHTDAVNAVALSPDGTILASASDDNTVRLWNPSTGQPIGKPMQGLDSIYALAFSPDGKILASGNDNNTVGLWDPATGTRIGQPLTGFFTAVYGVAFSPDGRLLAAASGDTTIRIWDQQWDVDQDCELAAKYVTAQQVDAFLPPGQHASVCKLSDQLSR